MAMTIKRFTLGLALSLALIAASARAEPPLVCDQTTKDAIALLARAAVRARDADVSINTARAVWQEFAHPLSVSQQAAGCDFLTDVYKSEATPDEATTMADARCDGIANGTVRQ
jgi:hypothetical protein